MAHSIDHHLGDRALAIRPLAGRFIINRLGKTGQGAIAVVGRRLQNELRRRRVGAFDERPFGILLGRFVR